MKVGRSRYYRTDWIILHCSDAGCLVFWLRHCGGKLGLEFLAARLRWIWTHMFLHESKITQDECQLNHWVTFGEGSGLNLWVKYATSGCVNMLWARKWKSKHLNIILSIFLTLLALKQGEIETSKCRNKVSNQNQIVSVCKALLLKEKMGRNFLDHRAEVRYPKSHLFLKSESL